MDGSTLIQRIIESDDTELLALHQRSQKRAEEALKNLGLEKSIYTDSLMTFSRILKLMLCSFAVQTLYMVNNQSKH